MIYSLSTGPVDREHIKYAILMKLEYLQDYWLIIKGSTLMSMFHCIL